MLRRFLLGQPRLALAMAAAVVAVMLSCPVPVLDEESYLDIASQLDWFRPYDWWRPWPPWGADREADAFVYAHPPAFLFWVKAWAGLGAPVPAVKVAAGLPWALLLGWSVGRLAERVTRQPWLAIAAWLATPISLLGLQRGLMPDLMVTAFSTYAVAAWVEADRAEPGDRGRWLRGSGLTLALACLTKYPALLLLPVLLIHARARRRRDLLPFWVALLTPFLLVEGWLWIAYGRPHLWEVISRAGEIPRGPGTGRALGIATRLGLGVAMLPLVLAPLRGLVLPAAAVAAVLALVGAPPGSDTSTLVGLALAAVPGTGAVLLASREWLARSAPGADVERGDGLLLGGWVLAVVSGVLIGHNFAAPRYLLPVMAPLALMLARVVDRRTSARRLLWLGAALQGLLSLGVTAAEHHFFLAGDAVARQAAREAEVPGLYTGEWSFRARMDTLGWRLLSTHEPRSGDLVAGVTESAPAELPPGWVEAGRVRAGRFPLRVVDSAHGVGLYGETIGPMPLGWRPGVLEEAVLWRVP